MKSKRSKSAVAPARIPLCKPYISEDEERAVVEVLRSGWLMQGSKVAEFERLIADYVRVKHAVAVNSGTSALTLAVKAVGLGEGHGVIMPSHSFVATANCVFHWGSKPAFVDIARNTYNINPFLIKQAADSHTQAIMVVHQLGFAADMDPILTIAGKRGLVVMEDAACSLGTTYKGQQTGGFAAAACLSFHPRKIITTGEGGMVLTNFEDIAETVRTLRNHGIAPSGRARKPHCKKAGFNFRMTDMQAAIGIAQFKKLEEIIRLRTRLAHRYIEELAGAFCALDIPVWHDDSVPNFQSFIVQLADDTADREAVLDYMAQNGIECKPGIQPIHLEPAYSKEYSGVSLPETIRAAERSFFLPLYPSMTDEEQGFVIRTLEKAIYKRAKGKEAY
ncbi:MAG: DegT/DnrJ/EryC1/StrS family aminotransferase [Candidatus Lindowbacteria bacterium]|nr:DegT/DnrJ/EryC1/StrS family aminotransferase [Candidatus Lindowbacteria bacterium]